MRPDELFASTQRPRQELLFRRDDVHDPRLGQVVLTGADSYERAAVVLLGCPQDEGVRRNGGRVGAAGAPDEIRRWLYRLVPPEPLLDNPLLLDLGNTILQPTLEATHDLHHQIARQVLRDGKRVIALGGGNDLSYPDGSAVAAEVGPTLALNIDAHFDVRADQPRNSGTSYRMLLEEGWIKPDDFYEIGAQPFANSAAYRRYLEAQGAHIVWLSDLRARGLTETVRAALDGSRANSVFWGFDLDSVRASDAPGVSAPNPTGLFGDELCQIAALAGLEPRTRMVEFTEVNPQFDIEGRTSRLTAAAIFTFLDAALSKEA